jgi:hypothetical protein
MKNITVILSLLLVFSCNNGHVAAIKAFIFERKALPGNKLFIAYVYKKGASVIKDSCIVESTKIPHDSISIEVLSKMALPKNTKLQ